MRSSYWSGTTRSVCSMEVFPHTPFQLVIRFNMAGLLLWGKLRPPVRTCIPALGVRMVALLLGTDDPDESFGNLLACRLLDVFETGFVKAHHGVRVSNLKGPFGWNYDSRRFDGKRVGMSQSTGPPRSFPPTRLLRGVVVSTVISTTVDRRAGLCCD